MRFWQFLRWIPSSELPALAQKVEASLFDGVVLGDLAFMNFREISLVNKSDARAEQSSLSLFRRRVRIIGSDCLSSVDVEDDQHRFGVDIEHDGVSVKAVKGRALRTPWTTCPSALSQLQVLVGAPLHHSPFVSLRRVALEQHCTHLVDMAALAIAAAARGVRDRQYDAALNVSEHEGSDLREGKLQRNDGLAEIWVIRDGIIIEPTAFSGLEMRRAAIWAGERADDPDTVESVFIMMRATLVAGGKHFVLDNFPNLTEQPWMNGACFAFQPSRVHEGRRHFGSTRNFAEADALLADRDARPNTP